MTNKLQPKQQIGFFELSTCIGVGGFGAVWVCRSTEDDNLYAIKLESTSSQRQTLKFETNILKKIQGSDYFPQFRFDGTDQNYYYLVMELLGPNLSSICKGLPEGQFHAPFILPLAREMISIIEAFHNKGYIHRDIKPQNFVARLQKGSPLCLVDYGISKLFRDSVGAHIRAREHAAAVGSLLYSSPNAHEHEDQSRRDDLYSFLYSVLVLAGVHLPWENSTQIQDVMKMKKECHLSDLGAKVCPELAEIGQMIENLGYEDDPDYAGIKAKLGATGEKMEWMTIPGKKEFANKYPNDPTGFLVATGQSYLVQPNGGCFLL